jgi:hypothetical protein
MADSKSLARSVADRVLQLEEELEASGHAATEGNALESSRLVLMEWVQGLTGVVASPALGRVTVIDRNGRQATIANPHLAFDLSAAVTKK